MSHLPSIITDLAFLLVVAGIVTILFKWLKQPVVLGYIVAGFLIGTHANFFPTIVDTQNIRTWGEIGVIFLLFGLGLEFSFKKLLNNSKTGFITLLCIIGGLGLSGFLLGMALGWGTWNSFFLGCMLCLSSTTIIVKAFENPRYKGKRFTEVVFGILIFDDLFAILLMVFMGTLAISRNFEGSEILFSIGKMLFFMIVWVIGGIFLIPTFLKKIRRLLNDETMLIVSLGMCLGMVVFATYVGLSPELGAFIMGSILAETIALEDIERVTKPIKDFFGAIFFVSVGMMMEPSVIVNNYQSVLLITALVIVGKIVFTAMGARLSGMNMKVSVQSGFSMAQVGEFSFIVAGTAIAYNLADSFIYPIIIAVSILTTFTTPYLMAAGEKAYVAMMHLLPHGTRQRIIEKDNRLDTPKPQSDWAALVKNYVLNVVIFTALCIAVLVLARNILFPYLIEHLSRGWSAAISLVVTLIALAPLLKGLVYKGGDQPYRILSMWREKVGNRVIITAMIMVRYALAFGVLLFTFNVFIDIPEWLSIAIALLLFVMIFRSKKLLKIYWNIEYRFVLNFNERIIEEKRKSIVDDDRASELSFDEGSWIDRHIYIADFKMHKGAVYVGRSLGENNFRKRYSLIIVAVHRGDRDLYIPNGEFVLEEGDVITVAGTLDCLRKLSAADNKIAFRNDTLTTLYEYSRRINNDPGLNLKSISLMVDKSSGLYNKSLLQSEMGRRGGAFVVGIENDKRYMVNPPATEVFRDGDIVWIIGKETSIHRLVEENFNF